MCSDNVKLWEIDFMSDIVLINHFIYLFLFFSVIIFLRILRQRITECDIFTV